MNTFDEQTKKLMIERMEKRLAEGRAIGIYQLGDSAGRHYTPQEMIEEAKKGTKIGEEFIWAEKKLMDELKRRM